MDAKGIAKTHITTAFMIAFLGRVVITCNVLSLFQAFKMTGTWRGIRTHTDAATSPSIAMYGVSTDCATETSPKKEAQIARIKPTAITVLSDRVSYIDNS